MEATSFVLDSDARRKMAMRLIDCSQLEKKLYEFTIKPYTKNRSNAQNALQHRWNNQIHEQRFKIQEMPVETVGQIRAFNKVRFGVPIMLEDKDFEKSWRLATGHLNYEAILNVVEILDIPITRLMNVKQKHRFLWDMKIFWERKGAVLTSSEDIYFEAMGLKR